MNKFAIFDDIDVSVDLYGVLGISQTADQPDVKKAYRKLVLIHHPDKGGTDEEGFVRIQKAYEVLNDPELRATYEERRRKRDSDIATFAANEKAYARQRRREEAAARKQQQNMSRVETDLQKRISNHRRHDERVNRRRQLEIQRQEEELRKLEAKREKAKVRKEQLRRAELNKLKVKDYEALMRGERELRKKKDEFAELKRQLEKRLEKKEEGVEMTREMLDEFDFDELPCKFNGGNVRVRAHSFSTPNSGRYSSRTSGSSSGRRASEDVAPLHTQSARPGGTATSTVRRRASEPRITPTRVPLKMGSAGVSLYSMMSCDENTPGHSRVLSAMRRAQSQASHTSAAAEGLATRAAKSTSASPAASPSPTPTVASGLLGGRHGGSAAAVGGVGVGVGVGAGVGVGVGGSRSTSLSYKTNGVGRVGLTPTGAPTAPSQRYTHASKSVHTNVVYNGGYGMPPEVEETLEGGLSPAMAERISVAERDEAFARKYPFAANLIRNARMTSEGRVSQYRASRL
eukprot:Rmarinus@m.5033